MKALAVEERWTTSAVRDAVRAALRSRDGLQTAEILLDENERDGDPVWAEDRLVGYVIDRLRKAAS